MVGLSQNLASNGSPDLRDFVFLATFLVRGGCVNGKGGGYSSDGSAIWMGL